MTIASRKTGWVAPWFNDEKPPEEYVEVPADLLAKYVSGEIKDGLTLAEKSFAAKTGGDAVKFDEAPAKLKRTKAAAAEKSVADFDFSTPIGSTTRV